MKDSFAYAVARVRSKETLLLNEKDFLDLLSAEKHEHCLQLLINRNWGGEDQCATTGAMLKEEQESLWTFVFELIKDKCLFGALLCKNDYHNLKAAIKATVTNYKNGGIFCSDGLISRNLVEICAKNSSFSDLPWYMADSAKEAMQVLLHTGDGQLCDVILDRSELETTLHFAKKSGCEFIENYAYTLVDCTNIKIAIRSCQRQKDANFLKRALASGGKLNKGQLIAAAVKGDLARICEYLSFTKYAGACEPLGRSMAAFEKWTNAQIIVQAKKQRLNSFSIAPIAAYVLVKLQEIRAVKIILACKLNSLPNELIKERVFF